MVFRVNGDNPADRVLDTKPQTDKEDEQLRQGRTTIRIAGSSRAPPAIRLMMRLFGPDINAEAVAIGIFLTPPFLLFLWLSLQQSLTTLGAVMSVYYAAVVLASLRASGNSRKPELGSPRSRLQISSWLGLFLLWIPSLLTGTFRADIAYAGAAFFGAVILWFFVKSVRTRSV